MQTASQDTLRKVKKDEEKTNQKISFKERTRTRGRKRDKRFAIINDSD